MFFATAVVDGVVYQVAHLGLLALDAATGQKRCRLKSHFHFHFDSPPAVVDGTVYIGGSGGWLWALDADTGRERWGSARPTT
ncbi:PQQ-binding-like beta-propeller repeat protein [Streptomyces sp. NPDC013161]|uniref:outer membrane protein assembly factor BamB family protein n=1 Tax=Streptomyces sp. NPDC013161 TaxID=3364862 RepID=UPI0036A47A59